MAEAGTVVAGAVVAAAVKVAPGQDRPVPPWDSAPGGGSATWGPTLARAWALLTKGGGLPCHQPEA